MTKIGERCPVKVRSGIRRQRKSEDGTNNVEREKRRDVFLRGVV